MGYEAPEPSLVGPLPWPPDGLPPPFDTLPALIDDLARTHGHRPALSFDGKEVSYAELAILSSAVAERLVATDTPRPRSVGLLAPNSADWVACALATVRIGAQLHTFNTWVKPAELDYLLRAAQPDVLLSANTFASNDFTTTLEELLPEAVGQPAGTWSSARYPGIRRVCILGEPTKARGFESWPQPLATAPDRVDVHQSSPTFHSDIVVYTSGSTQQPKAVPLEQPALIANGWAIGERMHLTASDRVWLGSPLFWSYGVANALMATLTHGACLVLEDRFDPARSTATMHVERCTAAYLLPTMVESLRTKAREQFAALEHLRTGLMIGRPDEVRAVATELAVESICNVYGATEVYGNCCVTDATDSLEVRASTQGRPLPGVEVRVVDPKTCEPVAREQLGDIQVRGRVMPGYLAQPDQRKIPSPFDNHDWYDTGDTGIIRADGRMKFVGRHSEMIKTSGINVSPAEIEAGLLSHPNVAQAAVVGAPDRKRDEVPVAFVVTAQATTESELLNHCHKMLSSYKAPSRIVLVDDLPSTSTGKLARKELLSMAKALDKRPRG